MRVSRTLDEERRENDNLKVNIANHILLCIPILIYLFYLLPLPVFQTVIGSYSHLPSFILCYIFLFTLTGSCLCLSSFLHLIFSLTFPSSSSSIPPLFLLIFPLTTTKSVLCIRQVNQYFPTQSSLSNPSHSFMPFNLSLSHFNIA